MAGRRQRSSGGVGAPRIETAFGVALAVWTAVLAASAIGDNSFFTHLATGRLILEDGVPRHDPYSYTAPGVDWVVQSWAASALYAVVEDVAGFGGLRALTAVLAGVLGWFGWALTRPAGTLASRVIAAGAFLFSFGSFISPRPLLFGLVAFAIVVLAEERDRDEAWVLAVVGFVWVNVHGSWPLGLVYLAASEAGRRLDSRFGVPRASDGGDAPAGPSSGGRSVVVPVLGAVPLRFAFLLGGVLLGGLVGLAGPKVLVFPLLLLGRSEDLRLIIEWQSPSFDVTWARAFLVLTSLAVLGLVRRPTYRGWLLWSVYVAAALLGLRNIPVAAIVLIPLASAGVAGIGSLDGRERSGVAWVVVAAAIAVGAVGLSSRLAQDDLYLDDFPMAALERAEQAGVVTDPDIRLVTSDQTGNLIEMRHGTDAAVFFDDRVDMYPSEVLDDFMVLVRGKPNWSEVLARHDVDVVLWDRGSPLTTILEGSGEWSKVHEDPKAAIYCRSGSEACERF